jgi:hypothetical protein
MKQSVKDGIGQSGIVNRRMPVFHRELTGDNSRASPVTVFKEFEDVSSVLIIEGSEPPIIENEEGGLGERGHEFRISPIALGNGEFLEEAR